MKISEDKLKKMLAKINEEEEEKEEEEEEEEEEEKPEVSASMTKLIKEIGDNIGKAVKEATGSTATEQKIKEDLLSQETGFRGIKYPELSQIDQWQKTYKTAIDPALKKEASDNIIVSFFKAWVNEDSNEQAHKVFKALNEGVAAEGGNLVPAPLATEIWRALPDSTVMRKIARIIPMTSDTLALNSLSARPAAYWVAEYAKKTTTSAEFDRATLNTNKLVCLLPITHELLADANISIAQYVIDLFVEAIGTAEDRAFFIGSGVGQPTGIITSALAAINAGATFNIDDLIDLIYTPPAFVRTSRGAAFVGNSYAIRALRQLKDTNGNYIWRDGGMFGGEVGSVGKPVATLLGYPFYEQNDMPQKAIVFGDWKYYIIGDRQQITVSKTDEGGDAWRRDATEFKAVERVDGIAVITSPFARLNL